METLAGRPATAIQVKCHSLAQIGRHLVEGLTLGDDGDLLERGDVARFRIGGDPSVEGSSKRRVTHATSLPHAIGFPADQDTVTASSRR